MEAITAMAAMMTEVAAAVTTATVGRAVTAV
jgi:hypothetical protein